jgi:hypothetical protein
MFVSEKRFNV